MSKIFDFTKLTPYISDFYCILPLKSSVKALKSLYKPPRFQNLVGDFSLLLTARSRHLHGDTSKFALCIGLVITTNDTIK